MKTRSTVLLAGLAAAGLSACSTQSVTQAPPYAQHAGMAQPPYAMHNPAAQNAYPVPMQTIRTAQGGMPELSQAELQLIGEQIFKNEGGGNVSNLVHWNSGEDFASMGIGHFTWYPAGRTPRFGNTFPELLDYMQQRGVQPPAWLPRDGAPWRNQAELMQDKNSPRVRELQDFLYQTRYLQTQFIVDRTRRAVPRLVNAAHDPSRPHVARNLNAVANTPGGWYALIDYTNFKGEGLGGGNARYGGHNWGLLQVLEEMRPSEPGQQALHEFADAAMRVLEKRVRHAPAGTNESRWLPGWANRVNTYRRLLV